MTQQPPALRTVDLAAMLKKMHDPATRGVILVELKRRAEEAEALLKSNEGGSGG